MRWKEIKLTIPEAGDVRTRRRYLWYPVCIHGECRWLEWATIREVFSLAEQGFWQPHWAWTKTDWIDDEAETA